MKIDLAKLLEDHVGETFYMYGVGKVTLNYCGENIWPLPIIVERDNSQFSLTSEGKLFEDAERVLLPRKNGINWQDWYEWYLKKNPLKLGDVVYVSDLGTGILTGLSYNKWIVKFVKNEIHSMSDKEFMKMDFLNRYVKEV